MQVYGLIFVRKICDVFYALSYIPGTVISCRYTGMLLLLWYVPVHMYGSFVCHCITPGIIINIMGKCQNRYYILKRSKKRTPRAVLLAHEKSWNLFTFLRLNSSSSQYAASKILMGTSFWVFVCFIHINMWVLWLFSWLRSLYSSIVQ